MNNIKAIRNMRGLSRQELAEKIGITSISLWNYETERRNTPSGVLIELAKELDASTDLLLGLKDINIG